MKEDKFIAKNIDNWQKLESYNEILTKSGLASLSGDEIKEFIGLYRSLSHNLSYARTFFPGSSIVSYLNQLIGTSHNYVFVREEKGLSGFLHYITRGLPLAIRSYRGYIFAASLMFMAGALLAFVLAVVDPFYSNFFFPGVTVDQLNLDPTNDGAWAYALFSSFIMTNNIQVSFFTFALGATAGLGTIYILLYNGMIVGALAGVVSSGGGSLAMFFAMILPHGFIELMAIFIAGGAGLMIGKGMLVPGDLSRKDSALKYAKAAAYFIPAIVIMLIIGALIEGFFTPMAVDYRLKLAFSFLTLFLMVGYYKFFIRRASL
ncbi:MAG: stage II sporulation protein M [Defluviitaleaceae bacterium]|nr:stage II sporulation protein M [Defluviitaleaceae bacterium]